MMKEIWWSRPENPHNTLEQSQKKKEKKKKLITARSFSVSDLKRVAQETLNLITAA